MVRNSKKNNSVFSEEVHLEAAEKLQLEKRIDELNFKRFDVQYEITEALEILIEAKWDAPIIQRELEVLLAKNAKLWRDIFAAEEAAGHSPECTCGE